MGSRFGVQGILSAISTLNPGTGYGRGEGSADGVPLLAGGATVGGLPRIVGDASTDGIGATTGVDVLAGMAVPPVSCV